MSDERDVLEDRPRGRWPRVWQVWAAATIVSFAIIEGFALVNDKGGDTLTEQLQYVGGTGAPWAFVAAIVIFCIWLIKHFVGPDSRVWKYAKLRRRKTTEET